MKTHKHQKGFSLIELLIVVAIIGILSAIAVPKLLASRRAAHEGSAQSTLRTLHTAEVAYKATTGGGDYGDLLALSNGKFIDSVLGNSTKSGYTFTATPNNAVTPTNFFAFAVPSNTGDLTRTGYRSFTIADDGVLRGKVSDVGPVSYAAATTSATWPPIAN